MSASTLENHTLAHQRWVESRGKEGTRLLFSDLTAEQQQQLLTEGWRPGSGEIDLRYIDFANADLRNADLSQALLGHNTPKNARLRGCILPAFRQDGEFLYNEGIEQFTDEAKRQMGLFSVGIAANIHSLAEAAKLQMQARLEEMYQMHQTQTEQVLDNPQALLDINLNTRDSLRELAAEYNLSLSLPSA